MTADGVSDEKLQTLDVVVDTWGIAADGDEKAVVVRWLRKQIRAKKVTAFKIRRQWWMNRACRDAALEAWSNRRADASTPAVPAEPRRGLSVASMKGRVAS